MTTHAELMAMLPKEEQHEIKADARELIQQAFIRLIDRETATLRELRQARGLTQAEIAIALHKRQEEVSRLEHRKDCLLSTLHEYVRALGGDLYLVADFPDSDPVRICPVQSDRETASSPLPITEIDSDRDTRVSDES